MRLLFAFVLLVPALAGAQIVETPQAFDSAGRVMVVTPSIAARLQLGPPAWRVVGDFSEARLYSLGGDAYVLAVTRRDGSVERYSLTASDRAYLRERVSSLPAQFIARPDRADRNRFIRNQTILGLLVYAPSFAGSLTDGGAGAASAYLLMAGATFFGASQLSQQFAITPAMRHLSTHGALHAAAAGGALAFAFGADGDQDEPINAGIFIGGLAGTAGGLLFGRNMTSGQAVASGFGADLAALTMLGTIVAIHGADEEVGIDVTSEGNEPEELRRLDAALLVGAAAAGYPLGYMYARSVPYNVSGGDIGTLWISGFLGASTIATFLVEGDPGVSGAAAGLTAGFLGGVFAGDRLFVRRFDHTAGDAWLMSLGGVAGGLIGLGVAYLVDGGDSGNVGMGLLTAGAATGVGLTHAFLAPGNDEGRGAAQRNGDDDFASRIQLNPAGAVLAATRTRGAHPLLSISF